MTKQLLIENSGLSFQIDKTGFMVLKGVPASGLEEVNGNGRKYTQEMRSAVRRCRESSCLVPGFDGALLSLEWKEALWAKFFMGAPARQRQSIARSNRVKRA